MPRAYKVITNPRMLQIALLSGGVFVFALHELDDRGNVSWECPHCTAMKPVFDEMAALNTDVPAYLVYNETGEALRQDDAAPMAVRKLLAAVSDEGYPYATAVVRGRDLKHTVGMATHDASAVEDAKRRLTALFEAVRGAR